MPISADKRKRLQMYLEDRYTNEVPDGFVEASGEQHDKNVARVKKALADYAETNRPLRVLLIHGSGRSNMAGCAHEKSNSALLLETALFDAKAERPDIELEVQTLNLRELTMEPCNGCVSTSSALCGFPCNCFPFDDMQTKVYPAVLRSDVLLMSTPVNQSAMSTRLKLVCDRLISMDGGFLVDKGQYKWKDAEWRRRCIALSRDGNIEYNQRLWGRVCAYFISSKDQHNPNDDTDYAGMVAKSLRSGFRDYGCAHPDPWYAYAAGRWNEDYSWDKKRLYEDLRSVAGARAKAVVIAALELGRSGERERPYAGRMNRT